MKVSREAAPRAADGEKKTETADAPKGKGKQFAAVLKGAKQPAAKEPGAAQPGETAAGMEVPYYKYDPAGSALERGHRGEATLEEFPKRRGTPDERQAALQPSHPMVAQAQPQPQELQFKAKEVDRPQAASDVKQIEALVQEITSAVRVDGSREVNIELNSRTLEGLKIQITAERGTVAVQFVTASREVGQLLARNIDNLQAALENRNVHVSGIRVAGPGGAQPQKGAAGGRSRGR